MKERKERRKGKKRKKKARGMVGHVAGGDRRWPETAGSGQRWVAKAPSPSNGGATLVKFEISEFLKWWFGERRVGPLERE